jgi:chromosome segregation ATPase
MKPSKPNGSTEEQAANQPTAQNNQNGQMSGPEAAAKSEVQRVERRALSAEEKAQEADEKADSAQEEQKSLREEIEELEETIALLSEGLKQVNENVEAVIEEASGCKRDGDWTNTALTEHGYQPVEFRGNEEEEE